MRLKNFDYSSAGAYFVTFCTQYRGNYFGRVVGGRMELNEAGTIVSSEWLRTAIVRHNVRLDEYVVMPDHFHAIIIIEAGIEAPGNFQKHRPITIPGARSPRLYPNSLGSILGQFKSIVTKRIRLSGRHDFRWQRNYYEHIIRNERALTAIRKYIHNNPIEWWNNKKNSDQRQ